MPKEGQTETMECTFSSTKVNELIDAAMEMCEGKPGDALINCLGAAIAFAQGVGTTPEQVHDMLSTVWARLESKD